MQSAQFGAEAPWALRSRQRGACLVRLLAIRVAKHILLTGTFGRSVGIVPRAPVGASRCDAHLPDCNSQEGTTPFSDSIEVPSPGTISPTQPFIHVPPAPIAHHPDRDWRSEVFRALERPGSPRTEEIRALWPPLRDLGRQVSPRTEEIPSAVRLRST